MHCTTKMLLNGAFTAPLSRATTLPPAFLLPAFNNTTTTNASSFSTSTPHQARKGRNNPERGISALHRSGLNKYMLHDKKYKPLRDMLAKGLPKPVLDKSQRSKVDVDPNHGLWGFFHEDRASLMTPTQLHKHGRGWTIQELRRKDWHDLHRLWWVCIKEINRLRTQDMERERIGNMYGGHESENRMKEVKITMKAIRHTLTQRWYAWENARKEAMYDEEINMYANLDEGEKAYLPKGEIQEVAQAEWNPDGVEGSGIPPPEAPRPGEARP